MILLKGGIVVDPNSGYNKKSDVLIDKDVVVKIADCIDETDSLIDNRAELNVLDAEGCIVGPGLVDIHVHFRDPGFTHKEDIITGAKAAAAGGFTSVVLMANTKPAVDNIETLEYVINKGKETDINVYTCANVTMGLKGEELTDFSALLKAGAAGFTDDGIPILDETICRLAMESAAKNNTVLSFHEENPEYITNNGVNHGVASEHFGIGGSDRQAEIDMVARDVKMALETGARINIQHISSKETLEIIREAKANTTGEQLIFAEATPHHIALTEEATIEFGTNAKMNPPLRTAEDRDAIIKGLKDDVIDFIATDHAPHAADEKAQDITKAPSGIIGLENALQIAHEELVNKYGMDFVQVFKKMSYNPAKFYGLNAGELLEGKKADIVVFDPDNETKIEGFVSKSSNSPFLGHTFPGQVKMTICNGQIIYINNMKGTTN